jgi:hypothetical protein
VLGGWFLICSSKAVLSASVKSLLGVVLGIKILNEKIAAHSKVALTNAITARMRATVSRCSFKLSDALMTQ